MTTHYLPILGLRFPHLVEVWCSRCERAYIGPTPPSLWRWLNEHWRFGLCRPPTSREVAQEAADDLAADPEFLSAVRDLRRAEAQPDGDGGSGYR